MKVDIKVSENIREPYAEIYTSEITKEITEITHIITEYGEQNLLIGKKEERMVVLKPEEIYIVRVEQEKVFLVTENETYRTTKRMKDVLVSLGSDFMQVSKSGAINLKYLESVEPYFNGVMKLNMKNGDSEYISRKYVPELKKYLGL